MGIPYVTGAEDVNLVDGMGMYNPFLIYYSKTYNDTTAYKLAVKQAELFIKYAVDDETGICSHGYRMKAPFIKVGSANWGRGNSWFALGLCGIDIKDFSEQSRNKVKRFRQTMKALWLQDHKFAEFIGDDGKEDISVTLPILYYLVQSGTIRVSEKQILSYSRYMHDGVMYNGSGECGGLNHYSDYTGPSPLIQAMTLKLLNTR